MPTYEYKCDACEHQFDEFHSITAKPLRKCPKCGKNKLRRLIGTGAGVIFKGGGFYETDYRSDSYQKGAKAEKESAKPAAESGKGTTEGGKSDAKPAEGKSEAPAKGESKPAAKSEAAKPASTGKSKPEK